MLSAVQCNIMSLNDLHKAIPLSHGIKKGGCWEMHFGRIGDVKTGENYFHGFISDNVCQIHCFIRSGVGFEKSICAMQITNVSGTVDILAETYTQLSVYYHDKNQIVKIRRFEMQDGCIEKVLKFTMEKLGDEDPVKLLFVRYFSRLCYDMCIHEDVYDCHTTDPQLFEQFDDIWCECHPIEDSSMSEYEDPYGDFTL